MGTQRQYLVERVLLVCSVPLLALIYLVCLIHLGWLLARARLSASSIPQADLGRRSRLANSKMASFKIGAAPPSGGQAIRSHQGNIVAMKNRGANSAGSLALSGEEDL
jgi:hypothetical protein